VALDKTRRDDALAEHLASSGAGTTLSRQDARTKLQSAEASLAVANETLQRTRLVAPVSGIVYQRLVEPGEAVNAGAPVLLIDETQRPVVKVGVTDRDLTRLRTGQRARVSVETLPASEVSAAISSIAPSPDPTDGQYLVQLTPDPGAPLRPGTLATVHFEDAQAATLQVPLDALVHRRDRDWVAVVEGGDGHQVAHLRAITAGRIAGKAATVLLGLRPGERIITEGAAFLRDGQSVQPSD
jgi:RND family efflux transporter MFP subunit